VALELGPTFVLGENGRAGYSYTNGTTGGAAYALAIGSKLRRDAQVTVGDYTALDLEQQSVQTGAGVENSPLPEESP